MLKVWPALEEESGDLFPFLKGFDPDLSTHENKTAWHLMERRGEGRPNSHTAPFESQKIITIKKVENNNQ